MPKPGDILNYKDYEFENGSKGNKLRLYMDSRLVTIFAVL